MNCSNCGTPVPPDERFCRNCGHEVVSLDKTIIAPPPTVLAPPPSNITQQYNPNAEPARDWPPPPTGQFPPPYIPAAPEQRRSPLLIPLAVTSIVLAIAALGVLVYFITTRAEEGSERASGNSET